MDLERNQFHFVQKVKLILRLLISLYLAVLLPQLREFSLDRTSVSYLKAERSKTSTLMETLHRAAINGIPHLE
jgi:hypothetical protein